jgi:putative ABC transport system substrate-binding protein
MRQIGLAVVLALSLFVALLDVEAQQRNNPRIGVIAGGTRELQIPWDAAFRDGLQSAGYVEGRNITIEWRYFDGRTESYTEHAAELVRLKVDVIVAGSQPGIDGAKKATSTIPIIMVLAAADPVRRGFASSLGRPGDNVTGFWPQTPEVIAKRLQLLLEVAPKTSRVAVLWDPAFVGLEEQLQATQRAAEKLGVHPQVIGAPNPNDLDSAFAAMGQQRAQAVFVIGSVMHTLHRSRIAQLARDRRLPSGCLLREYAEAGCLMSYSPALADLWRRSAGYVAKILRGARPGDLPIEQPTKFDLVINLKTAKALGLTIPQTLLLRADQVIE